ncbi:riboflavin synthase [Natronospira bacteriovora]|uniref:Riboflavin synthase n=1 Tax=Natronospira bacteriovora TaxID=3069753 RepID=A0ABU0W462_9GAMM|nr:riboflavin synthase [Natronospira sp. AB-CW4]MDQ2068548.1 riboflavin synthase [Natronospira sp. AB-CW4]
MFTGLIEGQGCISRLQRQGRDARLAIDTRGLGYDDVAEGDSIAINGVCLTAIRPEPAGFEADVSAETLSLTTLGDLGQGDAVNLERSLTPSTRMGGHFVTGHVDGMARCVERRRDGGSWRFAFELPEGLSRYVARKGSIAIDGISLTVNAVSGPRFEVNIIPHTLERTNLDRCQVGSRVNIEIDLVARYLERLMGLDMRGPDGGLRMDLLAGNGKDSKG